MVAAVSVAGARRGAKKRTDEGVVAAGEGEGEGGGVDKADAVAGEAAGSDWGVEATGAGAEAGAALGVGCGGTERAVGSIVSSAVSIQTMKGA